MQTSQNHPTVRGPVRERRRVAAVLGLVGLAGLSGCASLGSNHTGNDGLAKQRAAVEQFYNSAIKLQVFGLPSDAQFKALSPSLSDRLIALISQAKASQARELARHGGTEPPLVQGALFMSLFEGAIKLVALEPAAKPDVWQATLAYQAGADTVKWVDLVWLVDQPSSGTHRWVVDDIEFGGQWDFARQGRLSQVLESLVSQANR